MCLRDALEGLRKGECSEVGLDGLVGRLNKKWSDDRKSLIGSISTDLLQRLTFPHAIRRSDWD